MSYLIAALVAALDALWVLLKPKRTRPDEALIELTRQELKRLHLDAIKTGKEADDAYSDYNNRYSKPPTDSNYSESRCTADLQRAC